MVGRIGRSRKASLEGIARAQRALDDRAWSRQDLANEVVILGGRAIQRGISVQTVHKFFTGKTIDRKYFVGICKALKLSWKEISDSEKIADSTKQLEPKPADRLLNDDSIEQNILIDTQQFDAFNEIIGRVKKQKNKEIDVITISAINYDQFIKVDKISPEHESVITEEIVPCAGGSGANTVCGLSKLGKKTAIVGCLKNDLEGNEIKESFNKFSVDQEFLITIDDITYPKTGNTLVLVEEDSGKRQILVTPGINNCLSKIFKANNEELLEALVAKIKKSKILHLSSFAGEDEMALQLNVLERIKDDNNIIVSLTPGAIYVKKGIDKLKRILAETDIIFLYTQQLDQLLERTKEIKEFKRELSLKDKVNLFFEWRRREQWRHPIILVIKDYSKSESTDIYQNHISVADNLMKNKSFFDRPRFDNHHKSLIPKDTTGTGDALAAGFLYGVLEEKSIKKCVDIGFVMAKQVSIRLGARLGLPDVKLLKKELNNLDN